MTASKQEPKKTPFDDLVYATGRWEIYRQDAGMGEKDCCVLRNGGFFCRTEHEQLAKDICAAYDKSHSHSISAPELIIGKQTCEAFDVSKYPVFVQGTGWITKTDAERMFAATAAKAERERVAAILDEVEQFIKLEAQLTTLQWNDVTVYFEKQRKSLRGGER